MEEVLTAAIAALVAVGTKNPLKDAQLIIQALIIWDATNRVSQELVGITQELVKVHEDFDKNTRATYRAR